MNAMIEANLKAIQGRIHAAAQRAGRDPAGVTLVAVTKSVGLSEVQTLYALGVRHFGENRPELCGEKVAALPPDAQWHLIGNLQRRKVKLALPLFSHIDAVDRVELLDALEARCAEAGLSREILVEVNVSGEEAKHGIRPEELGEFLARASACGHLAVGGVMTMAPFDAPEQELRKVFGALRRLASEHALARVSMGMTDDFEVAIEEGATEVRIGRALFV